MAATCRPARPGDLWAVRRCDVERGRSHLLPGGGQARRQVTLRSRQNAPADSKNAVTTGVGRCASASRLRSAVMSTPTPDIVREVPRGRSARSRRQQGRLRPRPRRRRQSRHVPRRRPGAEPPPPYAPASAPPSTRSLKDHLATAAAGNPCYMTVPLPAKQIQLRPPERRRRAGTHRSDESKHRRSRRAGFPGRGDWRIRRRLAR